MLITHTNKEKTVKFRDINVGVAFTWKGDAFLKTDTWGGCNTCVTINCVSLSTGILGQIAYDENVVRKPDTEIVIK